MPEDYIPTRFPLINAVIAGQQEGKVFSGISNNEDNFFIIHKSGFSYLVIAEAFDDYDALLDFLINSKAIPDYFHIYDANPELINACRRIPGKVNIKVRQRVQLQYLDLTITADDEFKLLPGYYIDRIGPANFDSLYVFNLELDKRFWKSRTDFLQNSFGFCVFNNLQEPVSICYSACVVNQVAEIDVATIPEFHNKGFAKVVVREYVNFCLENKITANWDCFKDNIGSLKTAQSINFKPKYEYNLLSIFKKIDSEQSLTKN